MIFFNKFLVLNLFLFLLINLANGYEIEDVKRLKAINLCNTQCDLSYINLQKKKLQKCKIRFCKF